MASGEEQIRWVRAHEGGVLIAIYAAPGSSRSCVQGLHADALKVAVRSAPEKGKANKELVKVIAKWMGVSVRQVALVAGLGSRKKKIQISGVTVKELVNRLMNE